MYEHFNPYESCGGMVTLDNPRDREGGKAMYKELHNGLRLSIPYDFHEFVVFNEEVDKDTNQLRISWRYYPGTEYQINYILAGAMMRAQLSTYYIRHYNVEYYEWQEIKRTENEGR